MAQYPYNPSFSPAEEVQYRYFHDFVRLFSHRLPKSVKGTVLEANTILWQFSEKGDGPHYAHNLTTQDPNPDFRVGKKSLDLNISIKGREEFMQLMFGEVPPINRLADAVLAGDVPPAAATYPGMTNQDMIDLIFDAARPFTDDYWKDWIVPAGLQHLAIPDENRAKPYTGPKVEDLPKLTKREKAAILALMDVPGRSARRAAATYPGMTNQDMINLIFRAAEPFTAEPWPDWIERADLEELAIPEENRHLPYMGPKIENFPNLSELEKNAILAIM
jgi:hypothetical protein